MLPVSVNNQYGRTRMGYCYLTKEAMIYKNAVSVIAREACQKQRWECLSREFVKVIALYTMPKGCRQDVNNDKLTWDALEGIVYKNDNQIIDQRNVKVFGSNYQETILIIKAISKEEYEQLTGKLLQMEVENSAGKSGKVSTKSQRPAEKV